MGINNRKILQAACDKHEGIVDTGELNQENNGSTVNNICSLLKDAIYHSIRGAEGDGLEEQDVYIDIGEDTDEELSKEIDQRILEAKQKGHVRTGSN